uniref:glycosyltransferase family 87 protein n=1 Tax=Frankia sp. CiP1_Cm_nod2 TaxID=2897161 RepID=UPI0040445E49
AVGCRAVPVGPRMTVRPLAAGTGGERSPRAAPVTPVCPSREDPVVAGASMLVGGPPGDHARIGASRSWWTPLRMLMAFTILACVLAYAQKLPCRDTRNWSDEYQYTRMCYSDVVALYGQEGLATGKRPFLDYPTEYPPLIGAVMQFASSVAGVASPSQPVYRNEDGRQVLAGYTIDQRTAVFYDVTALLFLVMTCVAVFCTALAAGRARVWDAALFALAPALVLHLLTNWDIVAVTFAAAGLLAWSRRAPVLAGILFGLGAATKFYPLLFLLPLAVLALRAGRGRAFVRAMAATVVTAAAVWVPLWLIAGYFTEDQRTGDSIWTTFRAGGDWLALLDGHAPGGATNAMLRFVDLNSQRGPDWDSLAFAATWLAGSFSPRAFGPLHLIAMLLAGLLLVAAGFAAAARWPARRLPIALAGLVSWLLVVVAVPKVLGSVRDDGIPTGTLNVVSMIALGTLLVGIAALGWFAPRRPRLPALLFLTVVAFLVTNKVFSPQYTLWLVPLAALARPRWPAFLAWQASEAYVLLTRFLHFVYNDTNAAHGIGRGWFVGAVAIRDLMLCVLAGLVIREILRPELDVVRATGADDPAGGVLDGVPDRRGRRRTAVPAQAVAGATADAGRDARRDGYRMSPHRSMAGGGRRGGPSTAGTSP